MVKEMRSVIFDASKPVSFKTTRLMSTFEEESNNALLGQRNYAFFCTVTSEDDDCGEESSDEWGD